MAEIILDRPDGPFGPPYPAWLVVRQPEGVIDPMVISFRKVGRNGNLLNQTARWTPLGWDPKRWQPKPPKVPQWVIDRAVVHMLQLEVPS